VSLQGFIYADVHHTRHEVLEVLDVLDATDLSDYLTRWYARMALGL
jgi:hypothetical protein